MNNDILSPATFKLLMDKSLDKRNQGCREVELLVNNALEKGDDK
jgi:hypothetical protein